MFPGRLQRKRPRPRKSSPGKLQETTPEDFQIAGKLQIKRWRARTAAPGCSKIEARGGPTWPPGGRLGSFRAAIGRRSWPFLGRSWRLFGPSWSAQDVPRDVLGGSGEGLREAIVAFLLVVRQKKLQKKMEKALKKFTCPELFATLFDRCWAMIVGFFMLA